jgi:hypothetical protein
MMVRFFCLCFLIMVVGCSKTETPTGVSRTDVEGTWAASLTSATLMGRILVGESDWRFERKTFDIAFLDPPVGQAERMSGDWEFSNGKMVMTLRSSFPIVGDVGATDTLFVSVLNNQMSLQTASGSNILLTKLSGFAKRLVPGPVWAILPVFLPFVFGT